jgi:hypothetical protein
LSISVLEFWNFRREAQDAIDPRRSPGGYAGHSHFLVPNDCGMAVPGARLSAQREPELELYDDGQLLGLDADRAAEQFWRE